MGSNARDELYYLIEGSPANTWFPNNAEKQKLADYLIANGVTVQEWNLAMATADGKREINLVYKRQELCKAVKAVANDCPTVDVVELPYTPRPMLKDRNPFNTDVYCPECGTNLSGYYGGEPLPIVTCFNCGEILDPYKATTKTDGERRNDNV